MTLKVGALFAGIGGLEEGLRRTGSFEAAYFSEIDPGAGEILKAKFPGIPNLGGVETLDTLSGVDLVTAGFPCQDLSQAGRTHGIKGQQSGLVDHLLDLLDTESQSTPRLLIENVSFMLQLDRGKAMSYLTGRLAGAGYRWAYRVIDTRATGLPQRRRRVFLIASTVEAPEELLLVDDEGPPVADHEPAAFGFYWTEGTRGIGWAEDAIPTLKGGSAIGIPSPPAIWIPGRGIFTPSLADAERLQGFPIGWTEHATDAEGVKERNRWKLLGNAVSVPVAQWVGERLLDRPRAIDMARAFTINHDGPWPTAAFGGPEGRFGYRVSEWPFRCPLTPILDLVEEEALSPLSMRATAGFLTRYVTGGLRKRPEFIEGLRSHLRRRPGLSNGYRTSPVPRSGLCGSRSKPRRRWRNSSRVDP